jgi:hypothetical protein
MIYSSQFNSFKQIFFIIHLIITNNYSFIFTLLFLLFLVLFFTFVLLLLLLLLCIVSPRSVIICKLKILFIFILFLITAVYLFIVVFVMGSLQHDKAHGFSLSQSGSGLHTFKKRGKFLIGSDAANLVKYFFSPAPHLHLLRFSSFCLTLSLVPDSRFAVVCLF